MKSNVKVKETAMKHVKPKLTVHKRGGHGIDVKLHFVGNIPGVVYWSPRCNSYVLCEGNPPGYEGEEGYGVWNVDGVWTRLYSINGIGEIRWSVEAFSIQQAERLEEEGTPLDPKWDCAESIMAARYFNLVPPKGE